MSLQFPTILTRARAVLAVGALLGSGAVALAAAPAAVADESSPSRYVAVTPQRILDSRQGGTPLGPGETRTIDLTDVVDGAVTAVVLNVTSVNTTQPSYLTVWPGTSNRPVASNLQTQPGETRAVSVTVGVAYVDDRPVIRVFNFSGRTDYVVDLFGYYSQGGAEGNWSSFYPRAVPQRVLDTRANNGRPLANNTSRAIDLTASANGVPDGTRAVAVNLTAVTPSGQGYLTAWNGAGGAPAVSNVNFPKGRTVANFAVVPAQCLNEACSSVRIAVRNLSSGAHVVVDVLGYYAEPFQGQGGTYVATRPFRIVDTRIPQGFGPLGPGRSGTAAAGADREVPLLAANLTVTAVKPSQQTYLTVYPAGFPVPSTSTLNVSAGQLLSNATQIGVTGADGRLTVRNYLGTTNVVVDVNGGFVADVD